MSISEILSGLPSLSESTHPPTSTPSSESETKHSEPRVNDRFKLIFDNINYLMKVSRMNKLNKNQTKNMIHVIGIENIIPTEGLNTQEAQDLVQNVMILFDMVPSKDEHKAGLKKDYSVYISRMLKVRLRVMFEKLNLDRFVVTHIDHKFSDYASELSQLVY